MNTSALKVLIPSMHNETSTACSGLPLWLSPLVTLYDVMIKSGSW